MPAERKDDKSTTEARHERFAREYVIHHNATRAYKAAGYKVKSDAAARANASRLLTNANVRALIEQFEKESAARLEITKDRIERELARIGFADPRRFFDEDGRLLTPSELGDDEAAALSSVEVYEEFAGKGEERELIGYTKKVKFWDKKGALEVLGAKFGIGVKKTEVGRPGEFDELEKMDEKALRERAQRKAVKLGLGKVIPIEKGKRAA